MKYDDEEDLDYDDGFVDEDDIDDLEAADAKEREEGDEA